MALLISDRPHTRRPPIGTRLRSGHPLASGLRHAFIFNELNGRYVTDLVGNLVPTLSGTQPPAWVPGGGLHWAGTWSGATAVEQIQLPALIGTSITQPFTFEAWVRIPGATTGLFMSLMNSDSNTNATCQGVGLGIGNTQITNSGTNLVGFNEAVAWQPSGVGIPTNVGIGYNQIGMVYQPSPGTSVFFINGRRVATTSFAALSASSGAPMQLYIGGDFRNGTGRVLGDGSIGAAKFYTRALTDPEFAQLYVDPFGMMQPSNRFFRGLDGSAGPPPLAWHTSVIKVWK